MKKAHSSLAHSNKAIPNVAKSTGSFTSSVVDTFSSVVNSESVTTPKLSWDSTFLDNCVGLFHNSISYIT